MSRADDAEIEYGVPARHVATERAETRGEADTAQPHDVILRAAAERVLKELLLSEPFLNEVAARIADRLGLIPTAHEIARAVREEGAGQAVPADADRAEGHPTDPDDGLS